MRKGLSVALLTVAIASMGLKAMSMAPVIGQVPSPIVGDLVGATSANVFVYPDAWNLDSMVSDDATSPGGIIWSYTTATPANPRYLMNGATAINLASEDPNNPGAKRIDAAVTGSEENPDSNPSTVSIRDRLLSPLPPQSSYPNPAGGPGIVGSEVVTLIASDGSTYSTKNVVVYSDDNGVDRLSTSGPPLIKEVNFTTTTGGWAFLLEFGAVTSSTGANGLCMQVPAGTAVDPNGGKWSSNYGWLDLVQNRVYKVRARVESNVTTPFTTPLWTFLMDNVSNDGTQGQNAYTSEFLNLDNEGGASAAASTFGRDEFFFYFTPNCVQTAQWNNASTGAFTSANDSRNDIRLMFRILDAAANTNPQNRLGTLCMREIQVFAADITKVVRESVAYDVSNITNSNMTVKDVVANSTVTYAGGNVTLTPASNWDLAVVTLGPGDAQDTPGTHTITDNWPIPWVSDELLMLEVGLSANGATGESNPPDIVKLRFDVPTSEHFADSLITPQPNLGINGCPKQGAAQLYTMFCYTQTKTARTDVPFQAWRGLFEIVCHTALSAGGQTNNQGGVIVDSVKVTKVKF